MNENLYVPSDCPHGCNLDRQNIGNREAYVIAALYHPSGNKSLARRQAEAITGRRIANSSWLRHLEHLRVGINQRSSPEDQAPWTTRQAALDSLRESEQREPENGWNIAGAVLRATTPDEDWQQATMDAIEGLGEYDRGKV